MQDVETAPLGFGQSLRRDVAGDEQRGELALEMSAQLRDGFGARRFAFEPVIGDNQGWVRAALARNRHGVRCRTRDDRLTPLFQAVREATEEAVINSILKATTTIGRDGHVVDAIDPDDVVRVCRKFGVISKP